MWVCATQNKAQQHTWGCHLRPRNRYPARRRCAWSSCEESREFDSQALDQANVPTPYQPKTVPQSQNRLNGHPLLTEVTKSYQVLNAVWWWWHEVRDRWAPQNCASESSPRRTSWRKSSTCLSYHAPTRGRWSAPQRLATIATAHRCILKPRWSCPANWHSIVMHWRVCHYVSVGYLSAVLERQARSTTAYPHK